MFLFLTLCLLEVIASLSCLIVHINRHFEAWCPNSVLDIWPERKAAFCPRVTTSRSKQGDRETTQSCSQGPLCPLVSVSTCTPNIHTVNQDGLMCARRSVRLDSEQGILNFLIYYLSNLISFNVCWKKKKRPVLSMNNSLTEGRFQRDSGQQNH